MTSTETNKPLYGLVLSGGQSQRMGQDKALLNYHGKPQRRHVYELLLQVCDKVFISLRPGQEQEVEGGLNFIIDTDSLRGPINGILSALQQQPQAAWLVVACDLPLVTIETLQKLVRERQPGKIATAYAAKGSDLPEPLLAIWEPQAYAPALAFTQTGKACPRKFLLNQDIQIIHPQSDEELYNANAPEEYEYAKSKVAYGPQEPV